MNSPTPPQWINRLLSTFLDAEKAEYLICDLEEYYDLLVEEHGKKKANRKYFWIALGMLRPILLKLDFQIHSPLPSLSMWYNFLKVTLRNLARHKLYASVNILGLTVSFVPLCSSCFM